MLINCWLKNSSKMLAMTHNIKIGDYRIMAVDSVHVRKSVESLADTATIVLPGTYINKAIDIESKLKAGDKVLIKYGYDGFIENEFKGWLNTISTDDASVTLECEDDLYLFRKQLKNKQLLNISSKALLQHIVKEIDQSFNVSCDYDFMYDKFIIMNLTGWDVLKKLQDETKANIYFSNGTLHMHAQYSEITNIQPVIYDFAKNIEKSNLKYKGKDQRKYFIEIEGISSDGKKVSVTSGNPGGDKRSLKIYGVTDKASLLKKANEELASLVYDGFEGDFTGWLQPYCEPSYKVLLRDSEYPAKTGMYYVISVETKFSSSGGERQITIGKKLRDER